ncbi:MAG: signal peptide peptidase SppA, partial [Candidatus Cryptobacteroides sp.]
WNSLAEEIAQSRDISVAELDEAINNLQLCLPADFLSAGLVDGLLSRQELENQLAMIGMKDDYSDLRFIPFSDYAEKKVKENFRSLQKIAVVYANGQVVDGVDLQNVDGDRFASILEEIYNDDRIEAVVLRVNSPGGSVVASEKIRQMLDLIAEEKLLVASYGDYAASGGYWISSGADVIFANSTTLTGSIGVFGMVPDLSKLYKETLHIGVQNVNSHEHSDMFNLSRPLDKKELAYMQRSIESIYTRFVTLVSQSRDLTVAQVDEIAQGRVWTGLDALEIGLVDYIGGLNDALAYTASQIGTDLSSVRVVEYPRELTLMELLSSSLGGVTNDYSVTSAWANFYKNWYERWQNGQMEMVFATMPYMPVIR